MEVGCRRCKNGIAVYDIECCNMKWSNITAPTTACQNVLLLLVSAFHKITAMRDLGDEVQCRVVSVAAFSFWRLPDMLVGDWDYVWIVVKMYDEVWSKYRSEV